MEKELDFLPVAQWGVFPEGKPLVIAGPCSAESESQVMETALGLKDLGVGVFRAGVWKPRTHPDTFEGVGVRALYWLENVKRKTGMRVCTEVACREHVVSCLSHGIDMVWLGARTTSNPFLVQEIADALSGTEMPVLVKNPAAPDIELWIGALERLFRSGVHKVGVVHRGFSTLEKTAYRNAPEWRVVVELRSKYPLLPFFCDPSHIGGDRRYIRELSQRAMDLGLDGLMVETHCAPGCALSDASQQITPEELGGLLKGLSVRSGDSDSPEYKENMDMLRAKIDLVDEELLRLLGSRMELSRQIGEYKRKNNIAIIQSSRWEAVLAGAVATGAEYGLPEKFVRTLFNVIHDASVREQDRDAE